MFFINRGISIAGAFFAVTAVAAGQQLSVGVIGGATVLDQSRFGNDESKRYVVGAAVEYKLWRGLSVEADFLFRRAGYSYTYNAHNMDLVRFPVSVRVRDSIFELPVLGKYYFRREARLQPFALTGYSFRKAYNEAHNIYPQGVNGNGPAQVNSGKSWSRGLDIGATVGGGLQWKAGRVRFTPEIRYTRWGGRPETTFTNNNQVDVLFGIRF